MYSEELIDVENGIQSKKIFWEEGIYHHELETVFYRCWLFLTHESLVPEAGDFIVAKMVDDEVIVSRQKDGSIQGFYNYCTHRGNQLCPYEAGNARGFQCNYHGWAFGLDGSLQSVPFKEQAYRKHFDQSKWGLKKVAKIESYNGFIFACADGDAPSLREYLGEMAWYLDAWTNVPGGIEFLGPPARSIMRANWKAPAENFVGDAYHLGWTHASALSVIGGPVGGLVGNDEPPPEGIGLQVTTKHGHGFGCLWDLGPTLMSDTVPEIWQWKQDHTPEIEERLDAWRARTYSGQWNCTLFPNCSFLYGTNAFKLWNPIGPNEIEVFTWAFAEKRMPEDMKKRIHSSVHRTFGPAGTFESDDGDNLEYCTQVNRGQVTRTGVMNAQMGLGEERDDPNLPGLVGDYISEISHRGMYRFYAELLDGATWDDINISGDLWKESLMKATRQDQESV